MLATHLILQPREGITISSEGPATLTAAADGVVHFPPSAPVVDIPKDIPSNRRRDLGKELVPRDFDGSDKTTWRDFKSYFSFIVKRNGWTKTEAGLNLACFMKDKALTVLNELRLV